jgi:hypothetical protein
VPSTILTKTVNAADDNGNMEADFLFTSIQTNLIDLHENTMNVLEQYGKNCTLEFEPK